MAGQAPRFHVRFTPASASWLNLVERWFGLLTEKQIRRSAHASAQALEEAIYRYLEVTNQHPKPFVWTKTADEILANIARFCTRTSGTLHLGVVRATRDDIRLRVENLLAELGALAGSNGEDLRGGTQL